MQTKPLIQLLHPTVRVQCLQLLTRCTKQGILLKVSQTYRDWSGQRTLYEQGRLKEGHVVTNAPPGYSWHNWGLALDICFVELGDGGIDQISYDGPWDTVGSIGESVGLEWGGHWKHPDRPHFENRLGWTINGLLAKYPTGLPEGTTWPT